MFISFLFIINKNDIYIYTRLLMRLLLNDYITILKFYNIDTSKLTRREIKKQAKEILAIKLCRCIKKVEKSFSTPNKNTRINKRKKKLYTIAICKNSIFTKKKLKIGKFNCKKKQSIKVIEKI